MKREAVLDIKALRERTNNSPKIERQLLMLFMGKAERCLVQMQWLVFNGDNRQWQSIAHELNIASAHIHAKELAAQCKHAVGVMDDVVLRMSAYLYTKEAYEGLLMYLRKENLLNITAAQDS